MTRREQDEVSAAEWGPASVLAASNAWMWIPDGADRVETEDYLVVRYPDYVDHDTGVHLFGSDRSPQELVDEVSEVGRAWGRARMWWKVSDLTRPAGLEAELTARGGSVALRLDVLALPLAAGVPELHVPPDVEVRRVDDEATTRDLLRVAAEGFGEPEPDDARVDTALREIRRGLDDDSAGRVLAYVEGRPAACGGWTLAGPVCRLWGGATRATWRRRGAYRAVLQERLRIARSAGATLGLTHGVVDTSSPILRRAGFTRYGEEREICLAVG